MKDKVGKITGCFALILLAMVLASCAGQGVNPESGQTRGAIAVSGAWALYPMMTRWAEAYQEANPGVEFDISAGGAGKGMADALSGAVDIGMVSREITPEEQEKGAFWVAVTKDAVFPTINEENPLSEDLLAKGLTQETLRGIFITGEVSDWGQVVGYPDVSEQIHVYTRSDACGAAETWAKYLDGRQEDLLGIAVFGDPGLLDAVIKDPLGIGYNNLGYAYDMNSGLPVTGALILPIDQDGDGLVDEDELLETKIEAIEMVANDIYPSPPARELNLVTSGKPDGLVEDFIRWILTDGQAFVDEAGYIQLSGEQLEASLLKLE